MQQHLVPELEQRLYQQQEEIRAFYQPGTFLDCSGSRVRARERWLICCVACLLVDSVREGSEFYDEIAERRARISEEQESMRRAKEAVHNTLWTFYGVCTPATHPLIHSFSIANIEQPIDECACRR